MKKQVFFIHGGSPFANKKDFYRYLKARSFDPHKKNRTWSFYLPKSLGRNYKVISPTMPAGQNADYIAWKIWFERHFPFIKNNVVLVGHSLGGTFLVKYLSENKFPKKVSQIHLVAPLVVDTPRTQKMKHELYTKISSFKIDLNKIKNLSKACKEVYLWHSKDDGNVPFKNAEIIKER
ncbi:alpha/beta hydrolase, partial [Patescibacteria group bacterium]|nr:alpha/beta hydrolase [Patescibacteria group bacterium]